MMMMMIQSNEKKHMQFTNHTVHDFIYKTPKQTSKRNIIIKSRDLAVKYGPNEDSISVNDSIFRP